MSSSKKISQQQLRQMMKERKELQSKSGRETTQSAEVIIEDKKVESPLARYDTNGRLSCILCEQHISSGNLWSQHISSKTHRNRIEEMKKIKLHQKSNETKTDIKSQLKSAAKPDLKPILKRKIENESNEDQISTKLSKNSNISSDAMETEDSSVSESVPNKATDLPNDFFDDPKQAVDEMQTKTESNDKNMETESNSLPKGFFDDPVKDAKARKVVYKDPIDEQWEQFQKVMAEENNVSENIIEEDIEELQIDRNLEEIEEQIANWIKVNEMQKRAEILHNHLINNSQSLDVKKEDSDSEVDETDLNDFSNWRSRTALK